MTSLLDFDRNNVDVGTHELVPGLGSLIVQRHPSSMWSSLAALSAETPCTLYTKKLTRRHVSRQIARLLNHIDTTQPLYMTKTPDSLLFSVLHNGGHAVASVLHDSNMYVPPNMVDPRRQAVLMCVGAPGIQLTDQHAVRAPHCVSRCCTFRHIAQQLMALRPLDAPREIFHAPAVGRVTANMLRGAAAHKLSMAYALHAAQNAAERHQGFNTELPIADLNIGEMLMLRNPERVKMERCADGLLLYRDRENTGTKTLLAVVNSEATQPSAQMPVNPQAPVLVHKVEYSPAAKQSGFRFNIVPTGACAANEVSTEHTVQQILNRLSHEFANRDLVHTQCHGFVSQCAASADDSDSESDE